MKTLFILLLLITHTGAYAELFKWKDADGNIIYSDQPPPGQAKEDAQVDKETLPEIISLPAVEASNTPNRAKSTESNLTKSYQDLAIVTPEHDTSIRENSGNVTISVRVLPNIFVERGHKLVIYMDGVEVSKGEQTIVTLNNVDRGTHLVKASIVNSRGQVIKETSITSFTLHRYHI